MEKPLPQIRQAPQPHSKSQQKKLAKKQKVEEQRAKKAEERKKLAAERPPIPHIHEPGWQPVERTAEEREALKKQRFELKWKRREEMAERMNNSPYAIAFDLSFGSAMTEKELVSLAMQINTTFGWMRKAKLPFQLNICNYTPGSRVDLELKKSFPTEQTWKGLNVHHGPVESVFPRERLIYLSPDATEVLQKVEQGKVYVLGGLVDGTRIKGASFGRAQALGVRAMRIPVQEIMDMSRDPVLNLNHVAELLSYQAQTNDWQASWHSLIAAERLGKRFKLKEDEEAESDEDSPSSKRVATEVRPAAAGENEKEKEKDSK